MEFCEEQGFFHQDYENFRSAISDDEFRGIYRCKTDHERVLFVNKVIAEQFGDLWQFKRQFDLGKSLPEALEHKEQGNKAFQYEKWSAAVKCYNKACHLLPQENDLEMSLIVANRSAALFHLNKYEHALQDIELALELKYPQDMHYKLMERKARCYFGMKDLPNAFEYYTKTYDSLQYSNLSPEKREKWIKDTQKMIIDLELRIANVRKYLEPVKNSLMKKFEPYVDKALYFDCTETEGRFARTRIDLRPNHVLLRQLPHAAVVTGEFCESHCDHCCRRVEILFSCPRCMDVIYCSSECQKTAQESYHRFECGFLSYLKNSGANVVAMLALRIVTQKSLDYFVEIKDELGSLGSEEVDRLPVDDYRRIYNFVTHSEGRDTEESLKWAFMAALLNTVLSLGYFYRSRYLDSYIGTLLLHNLQVVTFNSHEISELQRKSPRDTGISVCIGAGLYPTLVLFNHSCDPGITRYFVGSAVFVRTVRNIPAGSVVAENYGQLFVRAPRHERRKSLKKLYKFDCYCQACYEDWPTFFDMNPSVVRFRCAATEGCENGLIYTERLDQNVMKCEKCNGITDVNNSFRSLKDTCLLQRYQEATQLYEQREYERALSKYAALMTSMDEVLVKPYREYHLCQQGIRRCSLELGNKHTERV
ncbi:conserved hypothetical protein [Culex quinquefasciatus]|uniref:MYND-type domain-containing protein n=1 Tax=Culex quinquefasciatus TaxID=7176 RepID=B0X7W2_CULQU|nr:conserved hypothetical protein [Culex quinquefasciatus]|eukprot:XP_001865734.1 conserved hypothetical protein [Culex quinquefasciatus]